MSVSNQKGQLYLGREYDLKKGKVTDKPVLYDARHLTTHGIILGMTGSGKTGLGIILLEEALLQGIPVLILDPKGDMTNLLLTFPELRPEDFVPWVDLEGARRRGVSVEEYAAGEARKWREGLAGWDITGERIARLRQAAQFTIFTPGSEAGQPVDVLHFFDTPDLDWDEHEETLRERIGGIVSALLGLVGVEADPLQSPEHILLARIIEHVWRAHQQLDLPALIRLLQKPPLPPGGRFRDGDLLPRKEALRAGAVAEQSHRRPRLRELAGGDTAGRGAAALRQRRPPPGQCVLPGAPERRTTGFFHHPVPRGGARLAARSVRHNRSAGAALLR